MWNDADSRAIVAALVWDVPTLRRLEEPGVRPFLDVMNRRPPRVEQDDAQTALTRAAHAVAAEMQGQPDQAAAMYAEIARASGAERLLGLCLQVWSSTAAGPEVLSTTIREIDAISDGDLRARLYCKLISAALSHHWDEEVEELLGRALAAAPAGGRLAAALRTEAYNLGTAPLEFSDAPLPPDPLTDYAWIGGLAEEADARRLRAAVVEAASSPWNISFGFGATTTDEVVTALLQAEWAGAIWLRSQLQKQVATHVLLDGNAGPDLTANGLSLWILSGQRPIESVADSVEHRFDHRSADLVIGQLDRQGPLRKRTDPALAETAAALWDLVSDETVVELLDRLVLQPSDHPASLYAAMFWATASVRTPSEFERRFLAQEADQQRALLDALTPFTVSHLPSRAAEALLAAGKTHTPAQAHIYSLLALRVGGPQLVDLRDATAPALIRLRRDAKQLVDDTLLSRALAEMTRTVSEEFEDAKRGKRGIGSINPISVLSLGLASAPEHERMAGLALLTDAALDTDLPADLRFDAVRGLTAVAHNAGLPEPWASRLRELPEHGAQAMMGDFSPAVMAAVRLGLRAAVGDDITDEALRMVRSEEQRIRELAVEACGLAERHGRHAELVEFALSSALFDPAEPIVLKALEVLSESSPRSDAVSRAVVSRLLTLFDKGGRAVRAQVVRVARRWRAPGTEVILDRAVRDRSYTVRAALTREGEA
jgi:hypothetical protein